MKCDGWSKLFYSKRSGLDRAPPTYTGNAFPERLGRPRLIALAIFFGYALEIPGFVGG